MITGKKLIQFMSRIHAITNTSIEKINILQFLTPTKNDNYKFKIYRLFTFIKFKYRMLRPTTIADNRPFIESTDRVP